MLSMSSITRELIKLASLASVTASSSCKAVCSSDFTLEPPIDEPLGGFFAIGTGNPSRWACVDSCGACYGGACRVAIAWVAKALAITPD